MTEYIKGEVASVGYWFNTGVLSLTVVERTGLLGTGQLELKFDKPAARGIYKQAVGKSPSGKITDNSQIINALLRKKVTITID